MEFLTITVRLFEIPLINCKVELILKWEKLCVLASGGIKNLNANANNIIFAMKDRIIDPCSHFISKI